MKTVSVIKMIGFLGTVLTSIPLFVLYLSHQEPKSALVSHMHIWFGAVLIIFAITNMVMFKKAANQNK